MTAESRAATAISPIREPGSLALSGTEGRPAAMLASIATGCQIELASRIPSVGNGGGDPAGQVFNRREELGVSQSIDAITDCELTGPPHASLRRMRCCSSAPTSALLGVAATTVAPSWSEPPARPRQVAAWVGFSIFPHAAPYRIRHRLRQIGKNGAFAGRDQDVGHPVRLELFTDFFGKLGPLALKL